MSNPTLQVFLEVKEGGGSAAGQMLILVHRGISGGAAGTRACLSSPQLEELHVRCSPAFGRGFGRLGRERGKKLVSWKYTD